MNKEFYYVAEKQIGNPVTCKTVLIHGPFPTIGPALEKYNEIMYAPNNRIACVGKWDVMYGAWAYVPRPILGTAINLREFCDGGSVSEAIDAFNASFGLLLTTVMVEEE